MGLTCTLIVLIGCQVVYLFFLNKRQERRGVNNGKPAELHD